MRSIHLFVLLSAILLSGCETAARSLSDAVDALPDLPRPVRVADAQDAKPDWVQATGYAPISLQPGQTQQQKMLMAMRASKLRAYQELAAIINGQQLYGTTAVKDMVVQNDQFRTAVAGIVRGAQVVKSYPVQDDTYATVLKVDLNKVERAWVSSQ